MPTITTPSAILEQNSALNYINYQNINQDNKEFLLSNLWDFEFLTFPSVVYFPGNDVIKKRLQEVVPQFSQGVTQVNANIRGFQINQSVRSGNSNCQVTLNMMDFEDQMLNIMCQDWVNKISDRDTQYQYRKEDTVCDAILTLFNTSRIPIRKYKLWTGQPPQGYEPQLTLNSDDPSNIGTITLALNFEHSKVIWENI